MIIAFVIIAYIFYINTTYGLIVNKILNKLTNVETEEGLPAFYIVNIVGFCFITAIASFYSIVSPISWLANVLFFIVAISYTIINFSEYQYYYRISKELVAKNQLFTIIVCVFSIIILVLITSHASHFDSGLYHAQAIRWIEKYKAIYGLGNIHGRLAFNSSFFVTSALFSFSFIWTDGFHLLNGYLFLLLMTTILYFWLVEKRINIYFYLIVSLFGFIFIRNFLSSPATDISSFSIISILSIIYITKVEQGKGEKIDFSLFSAALISFCLVTLKMSNAIVMLLPIYMLWISRKAVNLRYLFILSLSGVFILLPWIIRNVILSGYLVYPLAVLDIFDVDWKIPLTSPEYDSTFNIHSLTSEKNFIKSWAMKPNAHWNEVLHLPFESWFIPWLQDNSLYHKLLIISTLAFTILVPIYFLFVQRSKREEKAHLLAFWGINLTSIIFCFLTVPSLRFAYAFICIFLANSLILILPDFVRLFLEKYQKLVLIGIVIFYISVTGNEARKKEIKWDTGFWWQPSKYPKSKLISKYTDAQLEVLYPENVDDGCWYADKPCSPYIHHKLKLRGRTIEEGFKVAE